MASQNALPPLPKNQDWPRKKSAGNLRQTTSPATRKTAAPHSASFTRKITTSLVGQLEQPSAHNSINPLFTTREPFGSLDPTPKNQTGDTDDENQDFDVDDDTNIDIEDIRSVELHAPPGASIGISSDPSLLQAEVHKVNQHNQTLKMEVARLQGLLLQRLRGNSKFVGGGQFRSAAHNNPPATPKQSGCSSCASNRTALKKAKQDMKNVQTINDELQVKLSESLVARNQLVDSIAHREESILGLKDDLAKAQQTIKEQQKDLTALKQYNDATCTRPSTETDELYKKFKIQVEICNEKQTQLENTRQQLELTQQEVQKHQQHIDELVQNARLLTTSLEFSHHTASSLQQEVDQLKAVHDKYENEMNFNRVSYELTINKLKEEVEKWKQMVKAMEEKLAAVTQDHENVLKELEQLKHEQKQSAQVIQDVQKETHHLQLLRRKSCGDIMDLTQKYDQLAQQYALIQQEKDRLYQEQRAAEESSVRMANELKLSQKQLENLEREALAKACERSALESKFAALQSQFDQLTKKVNDAQTEAKEQADKLTAAQNQVLKQRSQVHTLQNELKTCKAQCEDAESKLSEQHQTHSKALEKAMQSLVRLCVVAPTVNVHLSGQILPCKSVLPKDAIRTIVQKDILPVFSSIFLQDGDGVGPTGSSLDSWLQSLLKEMQSSIEKHLKNVFQA